MTALRLLLLMPVVGLLAGCEGRDERFPLVKDGRAAPIVLPSGAEASTELAAKELADYVEKITGRRPAVLTNDCARVPRVEIGTLNTMRGLPDALVRRFDASPSWESHVVICTKDVLRIIGRDEVAELYGTYRFLEEKLDVRWFKEWTSEDPGDYHPTRAELEIPACETFKAPDLDERSLSQTGASSGYVPHRGIEWTVRLGLQACPWDALSFMPFRHRQPDFGPRQRELHRAFRPRAQMRRLHLGGGHMTFLDVAPARKCFAEHPEYFAEVKGRRDPGNGRYCLSNPELQRLVAEDIIRRLDRTGGRGSYLFGLQDGEDGLCECAACRALDDAAAKAGKPNRNISTRFHTVARNIAAKVYERYPDAVLRNWAYSVYRQPPTGVKLDPRTGVEMCIHGRCYGHAIDDPHCERNPGMLRWAKDWLSSAAWGTTYEYANCSGNYYCPVETVFPQDLKAYHRLGIRGWHEEMGYTDSVFLPELPKGTFDRRKEKSLTNWQWLYVAAKVSWDVSLDPEAVLADAESKYYGAAYPAMKEYQALRRTHWRNAAVCWGYGDYPMTDERTRTVLNVPGLKERLLALLDRAERLAADDRVRLYRVRKDREWLTRYWIEPNEKLRQKSDLTLRALPRTGPITVDGDASEADWGKAAWATEGLPERTDAAVLADDGGFYFLFKSLGAKDEMKRDRIGVVLYPPDADNTGKSYAFTADLKTGARGTDTGYVAELRADTSAFHRPVRGEIWYVRFFRNPDGNEPDVRYPVEIGEPWVRFGSFESVNEKGQATGWIFNGKDTRLVDRPGRQHAVKLGCVLQLLCGPRTLGVKPFPRKVRVSFRAWGVGKVAISLIRYKGSAQVGASVDGGRHDVSREMRQYSAVCEIPAGEWVAVCLQGAWQKDVTNDITIDDVSIVALTEEQ